MYYEFGWCPLFLLSGKCKPKGNVIERLLLLPTKLLVVLLCCSWFCWGLVCRRIVDLDVIVGKKFSVFPIILMAQNWSWVGYNGSHWDCNVLPLSLSELQFFIAKNLLWYSETTILPCTDQNAVYQKTNDKQQTKNKQTHTIYIYIYIRASAQHR